MVDPDILIYENISLLASMEALNLYLFEALISQMLVMWWRLLRLVDISVKYRPVHNPGSA